MALTRQFFNTPTGTTYQPAKDIERSFDKTSMLLGGMMKAESERLQKVEADFAQIYNNLGEIESTLMQNYAGIEQQAIMSMRDYAKEHFKKGGRVNDPEFQMKIGEMGGRVKAAMSNADRIREEIKRAGEMLKDDPHIKPEDKIKAFELIYSQANNPDTLISKNPFSAQSIIDQFIDPVSVYGDFFKSLPTQGSFQDILMNDKGDELQRTLILNPIIDKDNPYDANGRPNIVVTDELAAEVAEGRWGGRLLGQVQRLAQQNFSDLPKDVAFKEALRTGLSNVVGTNLKVDVRRTASEIKRQEEADAERKRMNDLAFRREQRLAGLEDANDETRNLYEQFREDVNTGSTNYLSRMFIPNTVEGIDFVTERQRKMAEYGIPDHKAWTKLTPKRRIEILEENGIEVPTWGLGWTESDKKEAYDALIEKIKTSPDANNIVGVTMNVKEGSDKGSSVFKPRNFIWGDDLTKLPAMFEQFENIRKKAKGSSKPSPEPPTPKTPSGFKNVPDGGFN